MVGKALVCGASIGGLFAALALLRRGWDVQVFERTEIELAGRGAGIVTHPGLIAALEQLGTGTGDLGVTVHDRVAFDQGGQAIRRMDYHQVVTSWDRIHQLLRACILAQSHHLGRTITSYTESATEVVAHFADGHKETGDILIGADGFRSVIRAQMYPTVAPDYSGYVVWRALAHESDLSPSVSKDIFETFSFFAPSGMQVIGYPIAGPDNDLRPGHRRFNFVWYCPTPAARLADMLTDSRGRRHDLSIPPPLVRDSVIAEVMELATRSLPPQFREVLDQSERPFFTPIYDHCCPQFGAGRVALSGDAACVARPHVGMGVTKAAGDALSLARHLAQAPVPDAIYAYSQERAPAARVAYDKARLLGAFMLAEPEIGDNADGSNNDNLDVIMRDTAIDVLAQKA